jgi:hypothetical protein
LSPETNNVYSGDEFVTAIDINTGFHEYAHYEFAVFFDSSVVTVNTSAGNNGVTIGTNGFISSVDTSYDGTIRIIGDRSYGIPSSGNNLYINWIASPDSGESTMLDLLVYILADEDNRDIGFPEGFPAYVYVTYTTPTPTPAPTPTAYITPGPDETPGPTTEPSPTLTIPPDDTPEPSSTSSPVPNLDNLLVNVRLPNSTSWGGPDHWIPNTGDILGPFKLRIKGPEALPDESDSIFLDILPPLDDHYSSGESGSSNIRKNRGTCQYVFYALLNKVEAQL